MRPPGEAAKAVLAILDPVRGGVTAAPFEFIQARLTERNLAVEKTDLYHILDRMIARSEVVRVETEDRGAMYTRPLVLLKSPGVATFITNAPGRKPPRRKTTSDLAYELRSQRAINQAEAREIARGAHDHSDPSRPCPVPDCEVWRRYRRERVASKFDHAESDASRTVDHGA